MKFDFDGNKTQVSNRPVNSFYKFLIFFYEWKGLYLSWRWSEVENFMTAVFFI